MALEMAPEMALDSGWKVSLLHRLLHYLWAGSHWVMVACKHILSHPASSMFSYILDWEDPFHLCQSIPEAL